MAWTGCHGGILADLTAHAAVAVQTIGRDIDALRAAPGGTIAGERI